MVDVCAQTNPPPEDYCDCVDSVMTRLAGQVETITGLTAPGACNNVMCAEGAECFEGSCRPIVQEQCPSDDLGAAPIPSWLPGVYLAVGRVKADYDPSRLRPLWNT